jgi:uncharacterized protein YuzE
MAIYIEKSEFDQELGYQYYVAFNSNSTMEEDEVHERVPVEVAISLSENGDLADFSFELPKICRSQPALEFVETSTSARYVEPRVYVTMPDLNGDAVVPANGRLELDLRGRIIGMEIIWSPTEMAEAVAG